MVASAAVADRSQRNLGIALVLFSSISWGSAGLFIKQLPYDMWSIVFWRGIFAVAIIGALVLWRHRGNSLSVLLTPNRQEAVATFITTLTVSIFIPAFQHTTAANVLIIYAVAPFITAGLAFVVLRERPAAHWLPP